MQIILILFTTLGILDDRFKPGISKIGRQAKTHQLSLILLIVMYLVVEKEPF